MSAASIARAASDQQLIARVQAMVQKEAHANEALGDTEYGKQILAGSTNVSPLMWAIAVATEAAYETALMTGRGAPGHDSDIITDADLTAAIVANWPYTDAEQPVP